MNDNSAMIYRFVYVRSSIHKSMWVAYFISTQYPSNGLVWWWGSYSIANNIDLHFIIDCFGLIYSVQMAA